MNSVADKTDETDITPFEAAAERALTKASDAYQSAIADQQRDIAQSVATKGHLGDGYWKAAHAARLRYLAADAVLEAVRRTP